MGKEVLLEVPDAEAAGRDTFDAVFEEIFESVAEPSSQPDTAGTFAVYEQDSSDNAAGNLPARFLIPLSVMSSWFLCNHASITMATL